jgi:hypothetical protein
LKLPRSRDTRPRLSVRVESGTLVRVFAIAHDGLQSPAKGAPARLLDLQRLGKPSRDRSVIGGGSREGLGGELLAKRQRQAADVHLQCIDKGRVIFRIDDRRHIGVVLGGRADHRRTADVDILDDRRIVAACVANLIERVEVDHQEIDRLDAMRVHRFLMFGVATNGEQTAMDRRMQRLHPPVHDFGKTGQIRNVAHRDPCCRDHFGAAAGRQEFNALPHQGPGKFDQAGLV